MFGGSTVALVHVDSVTFLLAPMDMQGSKLGEAA